MNATVFTEASVAAAIARQVFNRKCIVLVDNCMWTGCESDLLGVTMDRRLIDVEVKISRADLKADLDKDKWWHRGWNLRTYDKATGKWSEPPSTRREWPPKVWKHYYCMPHSVWKPELADSIPANSGVIALVERQSHAGAAKWLEASVKRRAKPNRDADRITEEDCLDIARLANLRMWAAYEGQPHRNVFQIEEMAHG